MKIEDIKKEIEALKEPGNEEWNHQYSFPNNIKTRDRDINSPGYNVNKWKRLEVILNTLEVKNKSFIDIGCSDGYYSIQIAKMGAESVLGTDLDPLRIKRANFSKNVLKTKNVEFKVLDLYKIQKAKLFDYSIGLGLLHRIPDMEQCIERMCSISKCVIVEFKTLRGSGNDFKDHHASSKSNKFNKLYKTPTVEYVKKVFRRFSFDDFEVYEDKNSHLNYPRTIIVAKRDSSE